MKDLDQYLVQQSAVKFSWRHWNCCHFALGFHGLDHLIPKRIRSFRDWIDELNDGLIEQGFKRTYNGGSGFIIQSIEKEQPVLGLIYDVEYMAFKSPDGIVMRPWMPHFERCWAAPREV